MARSKIILAAGIYTAIQSGAQVTISALAVAQYFCLIDFLQELPILLYIRVLYYHNVNSCGTRISIGQAIDGISDQAFVLLTKEPVTSFRTFVINCTSLGLGFLWLLASALLLSGGMKMNKSEPTKWPWVLTTIAICAVDVVAAVMYANDSFYTRTLSDIMNYIDGVLSGAGNVRIDTAIVAWVMVIVYSRFVLFFLVNVLFIFLVATNRPAAISNVEAQILPPLAYNTAGIQTTTTTSTEVQTNAVQASQTGPVTGSTQTQTSQTTEIDRSPRETDRESSIATFRLPRADFSYAFRRMKTLLFRKADTSPKDSLITYSVNISPERSPQRRREDDKKRTVNFPNNFQTFHLHLENKIADQQRRLDHSRQMQATSTPLASQSLPQLNEEDPETACNFTRQRRGTLPDLQSQLPWAYVPASSHRMRDQLPPDEDLPPVPLPDYNALRKTSVHRTASSLSSLTPRRDYTNQIQRNKSSLTQSDVLY